MKKNHTFLVIFIQGGSEKGFIPSPSLFFNRFNEGSDFSVDVESSVDGVVDHCGWGIDSSMDGVVDHCGWGIDSSMDGVVDHCGWGIDSSMNGVVDYWGWGIDSFAYVDHCGWRIKSSVNGEMDMLKQYFLLYAALCRNWAQHKRFAHGKAAQSHRSTFKHCERACSVPLCHYWLWNNK